MALGAACVLERVRCLGSRASRGLHTHLAGFPAALTLFFFAADIAALTTCYTALQESFDPIIDTGSGSDLLPAMVNAETAGDYDFQGMYSILLRYRCGLGSGYRSDGG